jgi:hypothetical protein
VPTVNARTPRQHQYDRTRKRITSLVLASAYQCLLVIFDGHRLLVLLLCFLVVIVSAGLVPHGSAAVQLQRYKCAFLNIFKLRITAAVEDTLLAQHTRPRCCCKPPLLCFSERYFHNTVTSNGRDSINACSTRRGSSRRSIKACVNCNCIHSLKDVLVCTTTLCLLCSSSCRI